VKILFHSNAPFLKSGYGQQTAIWTPRLASLGHDIVISGYTGIQHAHLMFDSGIPVLAAGCENAMGMDVIGYYYEKHQVDVVIVLSDAWALSPRMMALLNTVCWTPVDAEPLGAGLRSFFAESGARPVAMSRYGQRLFAEAGLDAAYIPHGLPMDLFAPPADRDALREASGYAPGTFVVGINQANRSGLRKALPEQLTAFARFHARHPDSKLMLHMAKSHPKGQDLPLICDKLGIGEGVVFFPDQGVYAAGEIAMEEMPAWYGALDVLLGCAMAGGFELPLLEAQACGTPVIATDGSAMSEVAGPHSWLVEGQPFWVQERHEGWWTMPLIAGIDAALEEAWQAREDGSIEQLRKQSREHALQYDADLILRDCWAPYLKQMEASL
jgi:glycosyltransferase involved in cell wall biosynthesis